VSGPMLSIVLASRDRFLLLRHAVASVLAQDWQDWELVICDDDSRDGRVRGFLDAVAKLPRVVVHRGGPVPDERRAGCEMVADMVNAGLDLARGRYVSLLCDDDAYLPDRCRELAGFLDSNPEVDVVVDKCWWLDEHSRRLPHGTLRAYNYRTPLEPGHTGLVEALGSPNYICHDSTMFRRTELRWDAQRTHTPVDWRFWCKLFSAGKRFRRVDRYGEEAYFPGLWARANPERIAEARGLSGGGTMASSTRMAINVSKKRQMIKVGRSPMRRTVHPGERIEAELVEVRRLGGGMKLLPGFEYCGAISFPEVTIPKVVGPVSAQPVGEVVGSLVAEPPAGGEAPKLPVAAAEPAGQAEPQGEPAGAAGPGVAAPSPGAPLEPVVPSQAERGRLPAPAVMARMKAADVRLLAEKWGVPTVGLGKAAIIDALNRLVVSDGS